MDRAARNQRHISIHAPRAGGDVDVQMGRAELRQISIHAPRAGGDGKALGLKFAAAISIHAPRAGGDFAFAPRKRR